MRKLNRHVTEPTEACYTDLLTLADTVSAHGRVSCDSRAEERRGPRKVEIGRNTKNEVFVHDDAIGIATVGNASQMRVRGVERELQVRAEILEPGLAARAGGQNRPGTRPRRGHPLYIW